MEISNSTIPTCMLLLAASVPLAYPPHMNTVTVREAPTALQPAAKLLLLLLLLATLPGDVKPPGSATWEARANMTCELRGGRGLAKEMEDHRKPEDMERTLNTNCMCYTEANSHMLTSQVTHRTMRHRELRTMNGPLR